MNRRMFTMLCGGIAVGLLTMGHQSQDSRIKVKSTGFVGPPAPDRGSPELQAKADYQARIVDLHPDESVVDNIAPAPSRELPEISTEVIIVQDKLKTFKQALARLARVQTVVGYGNFNIIGWDQSLRIARKYDQIGSFTRAELDFIEELFFTDAGSLKFYGDKVVTQLSATISKKDIQKIPATGHYLFRGDAIKTYQKIRQDIGDSIVLTSGIRSVVKQIYLFLNKAAKVGGNLSLASYSLAPPGHSYHAIGDFDVGKKNFGGKNFTEEFATTDEFRYLSDLGYFDIRYPQNNPYGVRYEPWHIKVV